MNFQFSSVEDGEGKKQMRLKTGCVMPLNLFLRLLEVIKRKVIWETILDGQV
jgi:hypothetical protein